jgi:hypothetical protein
MIDTKNTSCLLRPFIWIWNFIVYIVMLTGRVMAVVLGLLLILVGGILTVTLIGAIIGIPILIIGVLLVIRGLW